MKRIFSFVASLLGFTALCLFALIGVQAIIEERFGPRPNGETISGPVVIEQVRRVNKHVFIEQYQSVEITRRDAPTSWGDVLKKIGIRQEFVMTVKGMVPAGIDLSQLTEQDVWVSPDGRRIQLTLPSPQVFSKDVALDLAHSKVTSESDRCPDMLCPTDLTTMQEELLPEGQQRLVEAAYQTDILQDAADEAAEYYAQLLRMLDVDEIRVVVPGYAVVER